VNSKHIISKAQYYRNKHSGVDALTHEWFQSSSKDERDMLLIQLDNIIEHIELSEIIVDE